MNLENVLERRDQSRTLSLKREQRKTAVRKIKRAQARSRRSLAGNSDRESVDSDDGEQDEERQRTPTTKSKRPYSRSAIDEPATHDRDADLARIPEEVQSGKFIRTTHFDCLLILVSFQHFHPL